MSTSKIARTKKALRAGQVDQPKSDVIKTYKWPVDGQIVIARQAEITLGQEIKLAEALRGLGLDSMGDLASGLSIAQVVSAFAESGIVADFFVAILISDKACTTEAILAMPYRIQKAIIRDFFSFNPELISDLKTSVMPKITALAAAAGLSPPKKSSTSAPPAG